MILLIWQISIPKIPVIPSHPIQGEAVIWAGLEKDKW